MRASRWACSLLLVAACGGDDDLAPPDAGPDAAVAPDADTTADAGGTDAGVAPTCPSDAIPMLDLEDLTPSAGFSSPVFATTAPGDPNTVYVLEKPGYVILVRDGNRVGTFLDVSAGLLADGEQGLLGLAFHPDYATNGRLFLYFTPGSPRRNVVAEYRRSTANPDRADPTEVARLVEVDDSESNHNGGMIAFGPDGYLYVGLGDEGGGGDRHGTLGNGLDRSTLFGSILRLDVDASDAGYAADGNPFSGAEGLPQIYHYGLRNPWRFSFDRVTGDLWIADVGQDVWEEIDVLPSGTPAGRNLGWAAYEGLTVYREELVSEVADHYEPIVVYDHSDSSAPVGGASITGGYVYRGDAIPGLRGWYLYGDFASPHVGAVRFCDGEVLSHVRAPGLSGRGSGLASFGEDANGEVFVVYIGEGKVYRIVPG
ncbi:MAG: PQQ-dependent sugar dehydrogenase [Myxococcales bacterium]|nr:PQQ-dependent sugar dehydrogenase [Myxococcales bacterium]